MESIFINCKKKTDSKDRKTWMKRLKKHMISVVDRMSSQIRISIYFRSDADLRMLSEVQDFLKENNLVHDCYTFTKWDPKNTATRFIEKSVDCVIILSSWNDEDKFINFIHDFLQEEQDENSWRFSQEIVCRDIVMVSSTTKIRKKSVPVILQEQD